MPCQDYQIVGRATPSAKSVRSLLAGNHDPGKFENGDALDIHRKARGHLSFGHGVHQCLGQQLARIEMRAGFEGLLRDKTRPAAHSPARR